MVKGTILKGLLNDFQWLFSPWPNPVLLECVRFHARGNQYLVEGWGDAHRAGTGVSDSNFMHLPSCLCVFAPVFETVFVTVFATGFATVFVYFNQYLVEQSGKGAGTGAGKSVYNSNYIYLCTCICVFTPGFATVFATVFVYFNQSNI